MPAEPTVAAVDRDGVPAENPPAEDAAVVAARAGDEPGEEELVGWLQSRAGLSGRKLDHAVQVCEDEYIEQVPISGARTRLAGRRMRHSTQPCSTASGLPGR